MSDDRMIRLYQAIASHDGDPTPFGRLQATCRTATGMLPVTGVGVMLMAERTHQGTLYATDERIQQLEDLQNAAGEGPCIDSYRLGRPVLEPDLAGQGRQTWPRLAEAALEAGMAALFSFPLQLDEASVGALNLYRVRPGPLTTEQVADGRLFAAMVTREVLTMQAEAIPGALPSQISDLSGDRSRIEQATGMVAAQLAVPIGEAGRRLREHADSLDRSLAEIAQDVVNRELRFDGPPRR